MGNPPGSPSSSSSSTRRASAASSSLSLALSTSLGSSELRSVSVGDASLGDSEPPPSASWARTSAWILCAGADAARASCRRLEVRAAHLRASRSRAGSTIDSERRESSAVGVSVMYDALMGGSRPRC